MKNTLPKVFVNKIDNNINNSQDIFYGSNDRVISLGNINEKIKKIFKVPNFLYTNVKLKTKDGVFNKTIIGKTKSNIITKENERISIEDIEDIEVI